MKTMQFLLLCVLASTSSALRVNPSLALEPVSFLDETPSGVAGVMAAVEKKWLNLALQANSIDCDTTHNAANCSTNETRTFAFGNFSTSCHTVAKAVMMSSAGDRSRVQSYMSNVCGQENLKGKPEELCLDFSQYLVKEMSEYQHDNLEGSMDLTSICTDFFNNGYLHEYAEQERKKKADEEASQIAEAQRKEDEAEEAKANAEAEEKASEARARLNKMQNATAEADAKREEAVRAAVEAQRKADASEAAEELQKRMKYEADAASKAAEEAKAKVQVITQRRVAKNASMTNLTIVAKESRNSTAKSFLAVAPFTFS